MFFLRNIFQAPSGHQTWIFNQYFPKDPQFYLKRGFLKKFCLMNFRTENMDFWGSLDQQSLFIFQGLLLRGFFENFFKDSH